MGNGESENTSNLLSHTAAQGLRAEMVVKLLYCTTSSVCFSLPQLRSWVRWNPSRGLPGVWNHNSFKVISVLNVARFVMPSVWTKRIEKRICKIFIPFIPSLRTFSYFAFRFLKETVTSKDTWRTFSTRQSFLGLSASFQKHGIRVLLFVWNSLAVIFTRTKFSERQEGLVKVLNQLEWATHFIAMLNSLLENKIYIWNFYKVTPCYY